MPNCRHNLSSARCPRRRQTRCLGTWRSVRVPVNRLWCTFCRQRRSQSADGRFAALTFCPFRRPRNGCSVSGAFSVKPRKGREHELATAFSLDGDRGRSDSDTCARADRGAFLWSGKQRNHDTNSKFFRRLGPSWPRLRSAAIGSRPYTEQVAPSFRPRQFRSTRRETTPIPSQAASCGRSCGSSAKSHCRARLSRIPTTNVF